MASLTTDPVTPDSAFGRITESIQWNYLLLPLLRVAPSLGWLVLVNSGRAVRGLVGFSVETPQKDSVLPPRNMQEVKARLGRATGGWFNTDMTAKGLGSTIANTPQALQPHSIPKDGIIAVRSVPFTDKNELYTRQEADTPLGQRMRFIRHGALVLASMIVDKPTRSTRGTETAMRSMERNYGDAPLVEMPAPPAWQAQQRKAGVDHGIAPRIILARGGEFAVGNPMSTIGVYACPEP